MVFTQPQTVTFLEQQMRILNPTIIQMRHEGIDNVSDLEEFDQDTIERLASNLRRPAAAVVGGAAGAAPAPFHFGIISQERLLVATKAVKYYNTIARPFVPNNMTWDPILKRFKEEWNALERRRKDDETPEVPTITKALPMLKWAEAFKDFLSRVVGVRYIPLSYVIRDDAEVPDPAAPLQTDNNGNIIRPYSEETGSVEAELVLRASHAHPLYRDDNKSVYHYLEEATRSTQYASSLSPFQRRKDGRGAWLALTQQFAGRDKWEAEIKKQKEILHTWKWSGSGKFPLESFVAKHRAAYIAFQQAAEHIPCPVPVGFERVRWLLEAIETTDAQLSAQIAIVKGSTDPGGIHHDFERAVATILPSDPVARKKKEKKRPADALVGATHGKSGPGTTLKSGIGKTGVHLRWYARSEFMKLTQEQKDELAEWAKTDEAQAQKKPPNNTPKKGKKRQAKIDQAVKSRLSAIIAAIQAEQKEATERQAQIQDFATAVAEAIKPSTGERKSILKNASSATGGDASAKPTSRQIDIAQLMQHITKKAPR